MVKDVGELFVGRPDHLVLAFDAVMTAVMQWQPNTMGASKHTAIFTNKKAWLIVKPMRQTLDLKFYNHEAVDSELVKSTRPYGKKLAHHIRIAHEFEVTSPLLDLLRIGYQYAMA